MTKQICGKCLLFVLISQSVHACIHTHIYIIYMIYATLMKVRSCSSFSYALSVIAEHASRFPLTVQTLLSCLLLHHIGNGYAIGFHTILYSFHRKQQLFSHLVPGETIFSYWIFQSFKFYCASYLFHVSFALDPEWKAPVNDGE